MKSSDKEKTTPAKKTLAVGLAVALAGIAGTGFCGEADWQEEESDAGVVLGEEDLAERAEIARNMFRRITPGDEALVQDVGTWPVAWEEFPSRWAGAATGREYGAWVVPVSVERENGATVIRDADNMELWRGTTDFAKEESASVTLTGGLVGEEEWDGYEAVRDFVENASRQDAEPLPSRGAVYTNGLRFTSLAVDTNGTVELSLAWEEDGEVDVFAYLIPGTPGNNVVTWTNDENQVVTTTNTVWSMAGPNLSGFGNDWEWRGTAGVSNGAGVFTDAGAVANPVIMGFYAAAEANDTDGDGLNDGMERFVHHTDPTNEDTDGDGWTDGEETTAGTNPLDRFEAPRLARGVLIHAVKYAADGSNQWVQLHCSGPRAVDVSGFCLQAAGTNWVPQVVLPEGTWMTPGHFLLVGGEGVTNADVTAEWELAGTISNAPTAGVRLMPPEGATNGPVDVVMYAQNTLFNENGLDTTGWESETTNLWASELSHLERESLGEDTDADADWHDAADEEEPANAGTVLDTDDDGLTDEQEYMLGCDPFDPDTDGDGLLDGFEAEHGLDPTNGDTDGDGTPDGEEHDGNGGLYFWAQFADGVAVTAVTPSKAGWQRGESIGSNGTVRFEFESLEGVALWATFEDGGHQREPFTLTATHATIRWESELELVEWPLWRKTALIVPDDGAETFSVTVADERTGNPVTNEAYMGVDLAPWFDAVKLDLTAYRPQTEGPGYGYPFLRRDVPEEQEEEPGAGIRINGGDAANDRLEVEVGVSRLSVATNFTYSLRFSTGHVRLWDDNLSGMLAVSGTAPVPFVPEDSKTSFWAENPSGGTDDLTLSIAMNGVVFATDTVHFYPFTSIVIVFEGEFGNPEDPPQTGMSQLALEIYQRGYDVHAYDEPDIVDGDNTEEMAVAEILSALSVRSVTNIVLVGYSHGGGSVYNISERLSLETGSPIRLAMTAYIDAISQPLLNTTAEIRRPISSDWHLNYYQSRTPWYAVDLHGGASVPAGAGFESDLDAAGESVSHRSIDDDPVVRMGVLNHLEARVER